MLYQVTRLLYFVITYQAISLMSVEALEALEFNTTQQNVNAFKDNSWALWCKLQPNGNDCALTQQHSSKFYYDIKMQDCMTFTYGTCKVAYNKFDNLAACHDSCRDPGVTPLKYTNFTDTITCSLQPDFGNCYEYHPMFYYDVNKRKCRGFSYSGCGGNSNRFPDEQQCSAVCAITMDKEMESNH